MAETTDSTHIMKKEEIMERCFECYATNGFYGVGIKTLADACGISSGNLYFYFENLDDLIIQSTEYCMGKVEDDFMAIAPTNREELWRFIDEVPYWTEKLHGYKYRLMHQIYTHPKYMASGTKFFQGVTERYAMYAHHLAGNLGISEKLLTGLIFDLIRSCVHYSLFGDEATMRMELSGLKRGIMALYNEMDHQSA